MKTTESTALGIRRNDYIAAIRSDISELNAEIASYQELKRQALDLIQYCSDNKLRRFKKVAKLELKTLDEKHNWHLKHKKRLEKLLYMAEKYAPGNERT